MNSSSPSRPSSFWTDAAVFRFAKARGTRQASPKPEVETLVSYRGRRYATAVVSAWARGVRARGREPLYSTSWDNHASRALARRLGLILDGAELHMK